MESALLSRLAWGEDIEREIRRVEATIRRTFREAVAGGGGAFVP